MKYDSDEHRAFKAKCVAEGLLIDPDTALVEWFHCDDLDPYDVSDEETYASVSRHYFARRPDGPWIHFGDLPEDVAQVLWDKHIDRLATKLNTRFGPIQLI